jgi:hypothetical protein
MSGSRLRVLVAALAAGCSSSSGGTAGGLHGNVTIDLEDDHTAFLGAFFDGPTPPDTPLDESKAQGGCQLLVPRPVACQPACATGAVCTGANRCTPMPAPVAVGILHVKGLGGEDREAEPTAPTVPTYQLVPTLPAAACAEGGDVQVRSDAFTVAGKCVAPLRVTSAAPIPVMAGKPMRLAWTPPGRAGISRVQIELEISHHGGFKGQIECDVPDSGAFDVPEPLITALVNLGRAGYPTVKIARTAIATAPGQPNVRLIVASRIERDVDTGVVSCGAGDSPPCRAGATCQPDFTCR